MYVVRGPSSTSPPAGSSGPTPPDMPAALAGAFFAAAGGGPERAAASVEAANSPPTSGDAISRIDAGSSPSAVPVTTASPDASSRSSQPQQHDGEEMMPVRSSVPRKSSRPSGVRSTSGASARPSSAGGPRGSRMAALALLDIGGSQAFATSFGRPSLNDVVDDDVSFSSASRSHVLSSSPSAMRPPGFTTLTQSTSAHAMSPSTSFNDENSAAASTSAAAGSTSSPPPSSRKAMSRIMRPRTSEGSGARHRGGWPSADGQSASTALLGRRGNLTSASAGEGLTVVDGDGRRASHAPAPATDYSSGNERSADVVPTFTQLARAASREADHKAPSRSGSIFRFGLGRRRKKEAAAAETGSASLPPPPHQSQRLPSEPLLHQSRIERDELRLRAEEDRRSRSIDGRLPRNAGPHDGIRSLDVERDGRAGGAKQGAEAPPVIAPTMQRENSSSSLLRAVQGVQPASASQSAPRASMSGSLRRPSWQSEASPSSTSRSPSLDFGGRTAGHRPKTSVDSTSTSASMQARRRSLAFLASAISSGSLEPPSDRSAHAQGHQPIVASQTISPATSRRASEDVGAATVSPSTRSRQPMPFLEVSMSSSSSGSSVGRGPGTPGLGPPASPSRSRPASPMTPTSRGRGTRREPPKQLPPPASPPPLPPGFDSQGQEVSLFAAMQAGHAGAEDEKSPLPAGAPSRMATMLKGRLRSRDNLLEGTSSPASPASPASMATHATLPTPGSNDDRATGKEARKTRSQSNLRQALLNVKGGQAVASASSSVANAARAASSRFNLEGSSRRPRTSDGGLSPFSAFAAKGRGGSAATMESIEAPSVASAAIASSAASLLAHTGSQSDGSSTIRAGPNSEYNGGRYGVSPHTSTDEFFSPSRLDTRQLGAGRGAREVQPGLARSNSTSSRFEPRYRHNRTRSGSVASIDSRSTVQGGSSSQGLQPPRENRPRTSSGPSQGWFGNRASRLDTNGGAAALFGGDNGGRPRTASLLSSFQRWNRGASGSQVDAPPSSAGKADSASSTRPSTSNSVTVSPGTWAVIPANMPRLSPTKTRPDSTWLDGKLSRRPSEMSRRPSEAPSTASSSMPMSPSSSATGSASRRPSEILDVGSRSLNAGRINASVARRGSAISSGLASSTSEGTHADGNGNGNAPSAPTLVAELKSGRTSLAMERKGEGGSGAPTAAQLVHHALTAVPRNEIAAYLASSADDVHREALGTFMRRFTFTGNPLDIALRKLLMSLCLPKETQQIDRVIEAFAKRYNECNEGLFTSDDQPYILAFSLMMLHTDTFNKNAKNKMSKSDYIRNTSSSGVPVEILEYLFDNLTFTQFIYVEEEAEMQRRTSEPSGGSSLLAALTPGSGVPIKNRIDPYYLISQGRTTDLVPDIGSLIPEDSPFSVTGTLPAFDIETLNRSFVNAPSIEIITGRRGSQPATSSLPGDQYSSLLSSPSEEEKHASDTVIALRITKVGCISRKDDSIDGSKKGASRKWKTWGMALTSSQLLFFRDLIWTSALDQQIEQQTQGGTVANVIITPRITYFRPDIVLSLGDAIAMLDADYSKYNNTFRVFANQGGQKIQFLVQTPNEREMNDWIAKINFCACFRSMKLRIRGLDPPSVDDETASPRSTFAGTPGAQAPPSALDLGAPSIATSKSQSPSPPPSPATSILGRSASFQNVPLIGVMRRRLNARRQELHPRIEETSTKYAEVASQLNAEMRLARHLSICTPFQKATRERIEAAAVPLSHRIRALRIELARVGAKRDLLSLELAASERSARSVAPSGSFADLPSTLASLAGRTARGGASAASSPLGGPPSILGRSSAATPASMLGVSAPPSPKPSSLGFGSRAGSISEHPQSHLRHISEGPMEPMQDDGDDDVAAADDDVNFDDVELDGEAFDMVSPAAYPSPVSSRYAPSSPSTSFMDHRKSSIDQQIMSFPNVPATPSTIVSSFSGSGSGSGSGGLIPSSSSEAQAAAEDWQNTQVARGNPKRISLAALPDASELKRWSMAKMSQTFDDQARRR